MKVSMELKKELKRTVFELLLLLCLPLILGTGIGIKEHFDKHFMHFNVERKARMEEIFDITVTDNITLRKFDFDTHLPDACDAELELVTNDYEKFIANNINVPVVHEKAEYEKGREYYRYKDKDTDLKIVLSPSGDFLITLHHWEC